jgi:hypothetical protein
MIDSVRSFSFYELDVGEQSLAPNHLLKVGGCVWKSLSWEKERGRRVRRKGGKEG